MSSPLLLNLTDKNALYEVAWRWWINNWKFVKHVDLDVPKKNLSSCICWELVWIRLNGFLNTFYYFSNLLKILNFKSLTLICFHLRQSIWSGASYLSLIRNLNMFSLYSTLLNAMYESNHVSKLDLIVFLASLVATRYSSWINLHLHPFGSWHNIWYHFIFVGYHNPPILSWSKTEKK